MAKRVFMVVLDGFGIGHAVDAEAFGDTGANTLRTCFDHGSLDLPVLRQLGLFNIAHNTYGGPVDQPTGAFGRARERSAGKDTTNGHWELAGVVTDYPMPTFPEGFPDEMLAKFTELTGREVLLNKPYSGTDAIRDFGQEHIDTGKLIVYTSVDSVFQIAAHKRVVPLDQLYRYCQIAREMLVGDWSMGRVIARPFDGEAPNFYRTAERHDYSLTPPRPTLLDAIKDQGKEVLGVGKINDIFDGCGLTWTIRTQGNADGCAKTSQLLRRDFNGLCFVNLVDTDMLYGHRNDIDGYVWALNEFDVWLGGFLVEMDSTDVFVLCADHGTDPKGPSTDHTREDIAIIFAGQSIKPGVDLGVIPSFADVGATVADLLAIRFEGDGMSRASLIV